MAEEKKKVEKKKEPSVEKKGVRQLLRPKQEKKKEKKEIAEKPVASSQTHDVIKFVLMTEKAVRDIEAQNMLTFIVDRNADKEIIRQAALASFNTPVRGVRTMIDQKGRKKAFVKFREPGQAGEIAIRLGVI